MKLYNRRTNTYPIVVHAPGATRASKIWGRLQLGAPEFCKTVEAVETETSYQVITWNTAHSKSILEQCLDGLGADHVVLGRGKEDWLNIDKIRLALDAIADCDADIIIGLDAWDVVLLDHPGEIVNRFSAIDTDMLYNASAKPWPTEWAEELSEPYLAMEYDRPGRYRHLNAGAWVGRRETVLALFDYALGVDTTETYYPWSEQLAIRAALGQCRDFDDMVSVDGDCTIFQHMSGKVDLKYVD